MNKNNTDRNSNFKDHFSDSSSDYQNHRPGYPDTLFQYLSSITPSTQQVWDCATGSGQAAQSLTQYFEHVIATDASENQIKSAQANNKILFKVATAEESGLESGSMDLVCVAQALHWFNFEQFFNEVDRVLIPNGILAVWCYELLAITPEIDQVILHFYDSILEGYWPAERIHIENNYRDVVFPYQQLPSPEFNMTTDWNLPQLLGYFSTWSAVKRFIKDNGFNPLIELQNNLMKHWKDSTQQRAINWPLNLILCKKNES